MKKFIQTIITIIFFCATLNSFADTLDDYINKQATQFIRQNHVVGLALEVYDHGQAHSYYYGFANRETNQKVTAATIFDIGSVTKVFTALLFAIEVEQKRMQLFAPITKYLPINAPQSAPIQQITLLNLATHTAGLPFNVPNNIKNDDLLWQYLAHWQSRASIGTKWAYSNFGMGLLGAIIEHIEPGDYDKPYQQYILLPLKMDPIAYDLGGLYEANHAQGYDDTGKLRPNSELDILLGSWAMEASGADMLKFLSAALGLPGTPENILLAMQMTQTPYFITKNDEVGLGWEIYQLNDEMRRHLLVPRLSMPIGPFPATRAGSTRHFNPENLMDKTGSWDGFRSYIAVIPATQSGIVVMVNSAVRNGNMRLLGRKILFNITR